MYLFAFIFSPILKNSLTNVSSTITLSDKNLRNSNIIAILACNFLMIFSYRLTYTGSELNDSYNEFKGDIQIQNVVDGSDDIVSTIQNMSGIENCAPYLSIPNLEFKGSQITLFACDDYDNFDLFKLDDIELKDNEIIISKHDLLQLNLSIGGEIKIDINNIPYTFIISGVHDKPIILTLISLNNININYNSISVSTSNYSKTINEISNEYSLKGYYTTSKDSVLL